MSVLLQTSKGDLVVDLFFEKCPKTCLNFLALCKIKYYNNCTFFNVQQNFAAQTGDPTNTGKGGSSIFELIEHKLNKNTSKRFFLEDECCEELKHDTPGLLSMANLNLPHTNSSQFFISTSSHHSDYLDGKHTIFGQIVEGMDTTLKRINNAFVDERSTPLTPIRILKAVVLVDPFESDPQLQNEFFPKVARLVPAVSPEPILDGYDSEEEKKKKVQKTEDEEAEALKKKEARSRAVVLEILGDIPDAELKPPENVLFVCKLNPVTTDSSLELIFSRFGKIGSCEIIRDHNTGDSLCYGFIEFEKKESCEEAYLKMENVIIDDRRIHVDFSQSVSKLWKRYHSQGKHQQKHKWDDKEGSFHENTKKKNHQEQKQKNHQEQKQHPVLKQHEHPVLKQHDNKHKYHEESRSKHHHHGHSSHRHRYDEERRRKRSRYSSSDSEEEQRRRYKSRTRHNSPSPTRRRTRRSKS